MQALPPSLPRAAGLFAPWAGDDARTRTRALCSQGCSPAWWNAIKFFNPNEGGKFLTTELEVSRKNCLLPGVVFLLLTLSAVALFLIPAWIIQPFRHQSARALSLALTLRQVAPAGTLLAGVVALFLAMGLWPRMSRWKKSAIAAGLFFTAAAAVMARTDYFEWMFHRVSAPGFQSVTDSKLDPGEMVLAVRFASEARAYPIRAMAYHHVVNDVVSGIPIAVTY